jgi:hypothetical protein
MDVLKDLLKDVLTAQTGSLLIVFGMALLLLAIIGAVQGKIALDRKARLIGGALGLISLISGVWLQTHARPASDSVQIGSNATPPSQNASGHADTAPKEGSKAAAGSPAKTANPPSHAVQTHVPPTTSSEQSGGGQIGSLPPNTTPLEAKKSDGELRPQTCRINPKPWRWTTIGRLFIDVDGRLVGVIDVGKNQTGFDFVCSPGDHRYRVRSDTMSVACTGAVVFETGATTLDLVFSQTSPGPPDCSLASAP